MESVMKHNFSQVPQANIPRSTFNRTHGYKTMFDSGYLIPHYVDEALPGDTFNLNATIFARMTSALNVPVMDNMYLDTFYFAVPMRLVWNNFQAFMGEVNDPESGVYDPTDFLIPQMVSPTNGHVVGSLSDYFGLPTYDEQNGLIDGETYSHSSLWHRAYNLIYNEWFRDENLIDAVTVDKDDGPDAHADYVLLKRGKRHDYFTSALPWPQKGPGVEIPLGTSAPVSGFGKYNQSWGSPGTDVYETGKTAISTDFNDAVSIDGGSNFYAEEDAANSGFPGLFADLSSASAATINSLRESFQLQKLYERDARGGSRYTEIVRSHFGVSSPDSRLQRPEYLGGTSTPISVTPVQQTSETDTNTPQGNLAAFATGADKGGFTKSFTEHTLIIGIVNVRADLTYQQGLPRMFSRSTRWDFYWPALAHLGEQAILNKEICVQGVAADETTFGYQERWAEYRYYPSKITGKLRSTYSTPLDIWHLSQHFATLPTLAQTFIEETPPIDRIIAVTSEPEFVFDSYIQIKTARPMPTYSVPGLIDHF